MKHLTEIYSASEVPLFSGLLSDKASPIVNSVKKESNYVDLGMARYYSWWITLVYALGCKRPRQY